MFLNNNSYAFCMPEYVTESLTASLRELLGVGDDDINLQIYQMFFFELDPDKRNMLTICVQNFSSSQNEIKLYGCICICIQIDQIQQALAPHTDLFR